MVGKQKVNKAVSDWRREVGFSTITSGLLVTRAFRRAYCQSALFLLAPITE